jgi:hypothetical protein
LETRNIHRLHQPHRNFVLDFPTGKEADAETGASYAAKQSEQGKAYRDLCAA